jgi:predicted RNA binding protein YcfA (HicA-like mRNA interferase family)
LNPILHPKMISCLKALGWTGPYSGNKHPFMKKGNRKVTIPNKHKSDVIGFPLLDKVMKQFGISNNECEYARY